MLIGVVTITINLPGIQSLKQKRSIVKSLIERIKNRFNFSVAEVAANDSKLQAVIGMATVSNEHCQRNTGLRGYRPKQAHQKALYRRFTARKAV